MLDNDDKFNDLDSVLDMLRSAQEADSDIRDEAREAHLFVDKKDGQWEQIYWSRADDKPRYTFDLTSPMIDQIVGEMDQSSFAISVSPASSGASKDIALVYEGLIRNIEQMSGADEIYSGAARGMVTCGMDGWRVVQEYASDDSFDQDLLIKPIHNWVDRVWFDPAAERRDKSDAEWVVVLHAISHDEYKRRWPDGRCSSIGESREGNAYYYKPDLIIVGELLYRRERERELVLMSNGATYEVDDSYAMIADELAALGVTEVKRRLSKKAEWRIRFFDGDSFLGDEIQTVFGRCPIIPVYANYKIVEDKQISHGAVLKAMDPQRVLNYSLSREIEEGALAPRRKFWMTPKQAAGHEDQIETLNTNADPVQFYNPDPEVQTPPFETGGAQINPGLRTISESMRQMVTMSAGLFAANMGDNPGLQSGVAIDKLQTKGNNGSYKYFRSMEIARAATGRVLVEAIPKVYNNHRTMRLLYEDGTMEMTDINQTIIDGQTGQLVTINDLSQGVYDVVCTSGPAFVNRQQETIEFLTNMAQIDPSIMQIGGDVMLNAVSTPAAKQLAERKRALMLREGLIPVSQMTEEERQEMQQAQAAQGQQQDPAMVLAQAEMLKAQAELAAAQTEQLKAQAALITAQARAQGVNIDMFEAETSRMDTQIKAQEVGAKITKEAVSTEGIQLDNAKKISELVNPIGIIPQ